jgi:hypothetical protein
MPPWFAVILSSAVVMAVTYAAPPGLSTRPNVLASGVIVAGVLVSARYILEIAYRLKLWPRRTMFLWLLLTWCVPLLLELIRQSFLDDDPLNPKAPPMSVLGLSSPIGALVKIWSNDHQDVTAGILVQAGLALATVVVVYTLLRPSARKPGHVAASSAH